MKGNKRIKLLVILMAVVLIYNAFTSFSYADTRKDIIDKFLAQKEIKELTQTNGYKIDMTPNAKTGIDIQVNMGTETYKNTFAFYDSTCEITLTGTNDELGLKLFKNMWLTCADIATANGVNVDAFLGESGDDARENFWKKFLEKTANGEDTYTSYGVKLGEEKEGYIGAINIKLYNVTSSDVSGNNVTTPTNNATVVNKTANNVVKNNNVEYVSKIPNAGNNQEAINFFRAIVGIAGVAIVAFSIYNIKSAKKK